VANRIRFGLGAIEAAVSVFGPEKVGIRLSPWGRFQDMLEDVSRHDLAGYDRIAD
jgi:2,4-dienoyl-CoA reductase-like NADH-dependent reductase (Old Yellow Enzyme family)